jgi:PhoPQ-activated pathogenicity-related protein
MVTKEFEILMKYVEPYYFKEKFTMPKLLINAGSDEFFSTDSWRFYFNELPGDKYLQYIPNVNHSLNGRYLNENLFSFYTRIINDQVFPKLIWEIKNDSLISRVVTNQDYKVSIWKANNEDTRDFRLWEEGKLWSQTPIDRNSLNKYKINLINNNSGYTATMLEFIFNPDSEFPLILTTGPYVTPNKYPYDSYIPNRVDVIKND